VSFMATIFNLLLLVFVCYIFALQVSRYNQVVFDKYRFRYFALRDKLAMLVVKGVISENSWEYKQIIDSINFHIKTIESVSINKIIKVLIDYHNSTEEERRVEVIKKKIENEEVRKVMVEFMSITSSLLERNSKMQIKVIKHMSKMRRRKSANNFSVIVNHKKAVEKINQYKSDFKGNFTEAAA
jgi:uncharacterized protein YjgD (DUF1641 family)